MTPKSPHTTVILIGASRGLGLAMAGEYLNYESQIVATPGRSRSSDVAIATNSPMSGLRLELSQAKLTWLGAMSSMPTWVTSARV
jgi:NAD(P)-dependent dehydrogenase (short-subunit alcohol dehydrogenase family)